MARHVLSFLDLGQKWLTVPEQGSAKQALLAFSGSPWPKVMWSAVFMRSYVMWRFDKGSSEFPQPEVVWRLIGDGFLSFF